MRQNGKWHVFETELMCFSRKSYRTLFATFAGNLIYLPETKDSAGDFLQTRSLRTEIFEGVQHSIYKFLEF